MQRFAFLLLAGVPSLLAAQGFGIYEHGSCVMGRGGTAVAAPCADATAVLFNPAALAGLEGRRLTLGGTFVLAVGGFTDDLLAATTDLKDKIIPIPHAYASFAITPKLGVGIGAFAPYGLETNWPTDFEGRFASYHSRIREIYIQPTVAYEVTPWLKLGAGLDVVLGSLGLRQRADLSEQTVPTSLGVPPGTTFAQFGIPDGTDFADAHLEADGTTVSGHFGVLVKLGDRASFGARYLMKATVDYDGTADFEQVATNIVTPADISIGALTLPAGTSIDALLSGGVIPGLNVFATALADGGVATTITNPDQFVAGFAFKLRDDFTVLADYHVVRWSRFESIVIDFENALTPTRTLYASYEDTDGFRFGADWAHSDKLSLRAGYLSHTAAAPPQTVTPLLPEGHRNEVSFGVGLRLGPTLHADAAYQYVFQNDRRGRVREPADGSPPTTALNSGVYEFGAHLFAVTLVLTF